MNRFFWGGGVSNSGRSAQRSPPDVESEGFFWRFSSDLEPTSPARGDLGPSEPGLFGRLDSSFDHLDEEETNQTNFETLKKKNF